MTRAFANLVRALALLCASVAAHAVYLAGDGVGQALIYPYYTVQGGNAFNTFVTVVNTRNEAKVARVRFREGRTGREVFGMNLYLAPNDVWSGAVIPSDSSGASAARLVTNDVSCGPAVTRNQGP